MFDSVTLEMSIKPFKQTDDEYIRSVSEKIFEQWKPLIKERKEISIMLWAADGSEILDYKGNLDEEFEWCRYLGRANAEDYLDTDPDYIDLHEKKRLYTENPPVMTYRILKKIIFELKRACKNCVPKAKVYIGETFDIGPEFARSEFKYTRHPEICTGNEFGGNTFVNCYGILSADTYNYAGFPDGIPEGTPFGTFLGRQTRLFFADVGFDFLWLSNGMGFTANSWKSTGEIFNGKEFDVSVLPKIKKMIFDFWKLFREECPDIPIRTRGTNFSAGIDYASSAVPLYDIYNGNLNVTPPPNSPWAALDGNFGLELMGHMSRICHLPDERMLFRYYVHDPWWANTPWHDRYEGQPHDIYLPMSISRIDDNGKTMPNNMLHVFTVDNSWGDMPDSCANEPIVHLLRAEKDAPDMPSPFVWVYPIRENTTTFDEKELKKMMSDDWFICGAINNGFPLCTVVSTDSFIKNNKALYSQSVLISFVPRAKSDYERVIIDYVLSGGKVLFLGSLENASEELLNLLNIKLTETVSGELPLELKYFNDEYEDGNYPKSINVREFISNGGINTLLLNEQSDMRAAIYAGNYVLATSNGKCAWYRAPIGGCENQRGGHVIVDKASEWFRGEELIRTVIKTFGYDIRYKKPTADVRSPVLTVHRNNNGFIFSAYTPSTTVDVSLKFPLGAPLLLGYETKLENSMAAYKFPRAEHRECRVFVQQEKGIVGAKEFAPVSGKYRRRILVSGLENATVRFFGEEYCKNDFKAVLNSCGDAWYDKEPFDGEFIEDENGTYYEVRNVTGELAFQMPF